MHILLALVLYKYIITNNSIVIKVKLMDLFRPLVDQLPPPEAALLVWAAFLLLAGWYLWRLGRGKRGI